jgi:two-component system, OmpR family, alkaline phosphatase synthesis response regulator PhoP
MTTKWVLVIDDEEIIQAIVQFGIRMRSGWDVLTASSGAQGIQTAQAKQPDVILLDMMMPDMDGMETFMHLQSHEGTAQIPVIFLTAKVGTLEQHHPAGCGVISKPFNSLNLPEQIAEILHWSL